MNNKVVSILFVGHSTKWLVTQTYFSDWHGSLSQLNELWVSLSLLWLCINELCPFVFLYLPITPPSFDLSTYGNYRTNESNASDEHEMNQIRMVKLCNSAKVCHQRYCMEMLTKVYLEYGEVGYLIMLLLSGHGSMG